MLLFVINGATGIPVKDIVREGAAFFVALLVALVALIFLPQLTLWLPRQFGRKRGAQPN